VSHRVASTARDEQGSSTVLVLAGTGVLVMLLLGGLTLASTVAAGRRAEAAADLGALAAAVARMGGSPDVTACARARQVAGRNGATLEDCAVDVGGSVTVTVTTPVAFVVRPLPGGVARARARAGPDTGGGPLSRPVSPGGRGRGP
jgi:secretion/DNA translocation related TadE-like protein